MRRNLRSGMNRRTFLGAAGAGAAGLFGAAMLGSGVAHAAIGPLPGSILDNIKNNNGYLRVAVPPYPDNFYGFNEWREYIDEENYTVVDPFYPGAHPYGLEPDLARAIAAAVLEVEVPDGVPPEDILDDYIEWVDPGGYTPERFTTVSSGNADVGFALATYTLARDTLYGVDFGPTYFYDGVNIWSEGAVTHVGTIADTTGVPIAEKWASENGATWTAYPTQGEMIDAYKAHEIDGMLTDASGLISIALSEDLAGSLYLSSPLSKEPLSVVVPEGDQQWSDVVRWVMFALFEAEKQGITRDTVPPGLWGTLGTKLGLGTNWAYFAIKVRGNFKEIYEYNLVEDAWYVGAKPKRGPNDVWSNGGLIYPLQIR